MINLRWLFPAVILMFSSLASATELSFCIPPEIPSIQLHGLDARWQLIVNADTQGQRPADVTRQSVYSIQPPIAEVDSSGLVTPLSNGEAVITAVHVGAQCQIPLVVTGMQQPGDIDFQHQIVPIFTKLGCNGGGCHGKASGQAGFKLSLLGFEPEDDHERLVMESRGRRLFPAIPEQSLLLQKATNAVAHVGGQRLEIDSHEYQILHRWIGQGMPVGNGHSKLVQQIEIAPSLRQLDRSSSLQMSVVATFSDGSKVDVTRTALYESSNAELASVDAHGWVQIGTQTGDFAIMARYQGKVAVFRGIIPLGVPIESFPPSQNLVDEAVFAKLQTLGVPPSQISDDSTFIRRATLDICGRLPTIDEVQTYLASTEANKADQLVDRLLSSEDYANYFARKWLMILRNKRDSAGEQLGSFGFHDWLKSSFFLNKPYDQLVRELLTASGPIDSNPVLVWWREVADTESRVEDTAQLFLGQRLQCARCHHHPFEKWSQADYFRMSAFFSTVHRKEGVTPDNPVFVSKVAVASAAHPRSGQQLTPAGLDAEPKTLQPADDPRHELVDWMVNSQNPFFAKSLVNRYWKHFMGVGLVEPEDDMRVTNPPSNPDLMDTLSAQFIESRFDLKQLIRTICTSSTYRLGSEANSHNLSDTNSYSRYYPKRLQAEVLLDAIDQTVMTETAFDSLPQGTRATQLPDTGFSSYFLDVFGRPAGTTSCECERLNEATLAQSLHLLNSKDIQVKLTSDAGRAAAMAASSQPVEELINELYLSALARSATSQEIVTTSEYVAARPDKKRQAFEDIVWAIINSKEFLFNH